MDNEERDELDAIGDPDLLKLLLRKEREDAAARATADAEKIKNLGDALREARGGAPRPGPTIMHPDDYRKLPLDERARVGMDVLRGKVKLDEAAPRTRDLHPPKRMTRAEIDALPLDERVKTQQDVFKGKVQLVG